MAVFTDSRNRHYQNDRQRPLALGEVFYNFTKEYTGTVFGVKDGGGYEIEWRSTARPDKVYSTGNLSDADRKRYPIFMEVRKPTVIIG